ncbi:thiamine phosphate synthase [Sporanaerobium hydrogeniformans]|uniref:Thiamine phosphate synthase n=1 Tax=Sporanaerobium hydrogeniformans TaxID=3072179 RepID=A0AC61D5Z6_9FIRM|nr:thiamine phosphate synthase [Sporanaerobium hydrogeniformans]PHV69181.1 thiamine phosphate synthase [Sporanaerobium hydrogeniformans]
MSFDLTLYLVTDSTGLEEACFLQKVESACKGGVTLVQLREKERPGREYLEMAHKVKKITDAYTIPLIIDDRVDVALAVDAAGVHLGQSDLPIDVARRLMGPDKLIGATAKTVEQALKAVKEGADYLGVGAIYPTTTKVKTVLTKVSTLNEIGEAVGCPIVAIGGLNGENCEILKDSPIAGIAVVSALMKAENPEEAAKQLKEKIQAWKNNL